MLLYTHIMVYVQMSQILHIIYSVRNLFESKKILLAVKLVFVEYMILVTYLSFELIVIQIKNKKVTERLNFRWNLARYKLESAILIIWVALSAFEVKISQGIELFDFLWNCSTNIVRLCRIIRILSYCLLPLIRANPSNGTYQIQFYPNTLSRPYMPVLPMRIH